MKPVHFLLLCCAAAMLSGCSEKIKTEQPAKSGPAPVYFKVNPETAGTISGRIRFTGKKPAPQVIDMSEEPACVEAHHGKAYDESLVVSRKGGLANVFVFVNTGLEGKTFEGPAKHVTID